MNRIQTTDDVCAALENEAKSRAEAMGSAHISERNAAYNAMTFEPIGMNEFRASTNMGDQIDLIDLVMEAVEHRHSLDFRPHRDGGGVQTVLWSLA